MSYAPQAIHSNLSRPHPTDSRLLQNLIKGEKSYIDNLAASSISAYAAASALAAWGTSEAPDISKASQALAEILGTVADAHRTHVQALEGYRSALKDVLDREQSIRSVVRDRDILVGRLIKASKKKVSKKDSGLSQDEKMDKVNAAQRELHACEQVLASEEAALVGVKRRTFKEALTMRMKTMGDAGAATVEAAKEAILLLDEFDTHGPLLQVTGGGQYESMYADGGIETGAYDNHALDQGYYAGQHPGAPGLPPQNAYADGGYDGAHGSPVAGNGANLTRDEQGQFHKHLQGKFQDQSCRGLVAFSHSRCTSPSQGRRAPCSASEARNRCPIKACLLACLPACLAADELQLESAISSPDPLSSRSIVCGGCRRRENGIADAILHVFRLFSLTLPLLTSLCWIFAPIYVLHCTDAEFAA